MDWGHHSVKVVGLQKKGGTFRLTHCAVFTVPSDKESVSVEEKIAQKIDAWHGRDAAIVVGVGGNDVIARYIKLPDMPEGEFRKAALWEVRDQLYFGVEDAILWADYLGKITEGAVKKTHGVVYAVRKSAVFDRLRNHQKSTLQPRMIVLSAEADRLAWHRHTKEPVLLLNIGYSRTQISIVRQRKVVFLRDVNFGTGQIQTEISSNLGISDREAESVMKRIRLENGVITLPGSSYSKQDMEFLFHFIEIALEPLVDEIQLSLQFFSSQLHESVIEISLLGGGALISGFKPYLEDKIGLPVDINNPFQSIEIDENDFDRESLYKIASLFSTAVGLAKSRFASNKQSLNLLEIIKEKEKTERKKGAAFRIASLSAVLFILILGFFFSQKTTALQNKKIVLDAKYKAIQNRLKLLKELEEKTGLLSSKFKTLLEIKGEQPRWSIILKSLGRTLPEGTWITDFKGARAEQTDTAGGDPDSPEEETDAAYWQLSLKGRSFSGANVRIFYNQLQNMPYFSDVIITRIARAENEQADNLLEFEINCQMAKNFSQTVQARDEH
ncbi:MAG: type IV pilus assembly protein PilM [Calditrichaeota bacterium]|nr:type IV pilus assembly protein PilM [Calditrichota bacterium]